MAHEWKSEGNLQDPILSFHHVGAGDLTQVVRHGSRYPYTMIILPALEIA